MVVVVAVSKTILDTISTIVNLKPKTVAKYGFFAGFLTCASVAALMALGIVAVTMRPEPVFRTALAMIQRSALVDEKLGSQTGAFGGSDQSVDTRAEARVLARAPKEKNDFFSH